MSTLFGGTSITGINVYTDAVAATPVDGTGGAGTGLTTTLNTASSPLRPTGNQRFSKDGSNRQGAGWSTDITLNRADYEGGKPVFIKFKYKPSSGYVNNDVRMFVYDKDGTTLLTALSLTGDGSIAYSGQATSFVAAFYPNSSNDDYRIIWHIAGTTAAAWDLDIIDLNVTPDSSVPGAIVGDYGTEAWTDSWANSTTSVRLLRIGTKIFVEGTSTITGAGASGFDITIPTAYTPVDSVGAGDKQMGTAILTDTGTAFFTGLLLRSATNTLTIVANLDSGTYGGVQGLTSTIPHTWASTDTIKFSASWDVSGWLASSALTTTETLLSSARVEATRSSTQQTFTTGSTSTIVFDTEITDNLGAYNPSTGEFTAPKNGTYFVSTNFYSDTQTTFATNERLIIYIYKNGSHHKTLGVKSDGSQTQTGINGSALVTLAKGDILTIRLFQDSGASQLTFATANYTNLTIHEVPDYSIFSVFGVSEYQSSTASTTNLPTTTQYGDLTSISLTPGEWDLGFNVLGHRNTASEASWTVFAAGISTTSGDSTSGLALTSNWVRQTQTYGFGVDAPLCLSGYRVTITATTTYYLKYSGTYSANQPQAEGTIFARRIK